MHLLIGITQDNVNSNRAGCNVGVLDHWGIRDKHTQINGYITCHIFSELFCESNVQGRISLIGNIELAHRKSETGYNPETTTPEEPLPPRMRRGSAPAAPPT